MRAILRAKPRTAADGGGWRPPHAHPGGGALNAWLGWAPAAAALLAGHAAYGWRGLVLALTVVAFWLLLQFSRAVRALREVAHAPPGHVASAVMLNARLHAGMRLADVLKVTRSLGRALPAAEGGASEAFAWRDEAGDEVQVALARGRVTTWRLLRAAPPEGGSGDRPRSLTHSQTHS